MFSCLKKNENHIELPVVGGKYLSEEIPEHVDRDLISFITSSFRKVECNKYRPITDLPDAFCECGRCLEEHDFDKNLLSLEAKVEGPKITLPTDAFGEINFGSRNSKMYVRLSDDTAMALVVDFMKRCWKLQKPNLLISITGGMRNFTLKPSLKKVFREAFIEAAQTTGAWIITGGMNTGVMKHIGEALKHYTLKHGSKFSVPLIGVASWGCTLNRDCLIGSTGKWPAKYTMVAGKQTLESALDPNHTHFLLVDNGSMHVYGTEAVFKAELERSVANSPTYLAESSDIVSIPTVLVVVEGGVETFKEVNKAVTSATPTIIVQGSGRAADILAHAYHGAKLDEVSGVDSFGKIQSKEISIIEDWLEEELKSMIRNDMNIRDDEMIDQCYREVKYCVRAREYITIFKLDGRDSTLDIDVTIFTALLKSHKGKRIDQMKLALAWNRADIVREQIYTDDAVFEPEALYKLMYKALTQGKIEFVKVLLKRGLNLREFTTMKRVINLLNEPILLKTCKHLKKYSNGGPISLVHVGLLMQDLVGGFYEPTFCKAPWKDIDPQEYLYSNRKSLVNHKKGLMLKLKMFDNDKAVKKAEVCLDFKDPGNFLFIWCILTHMKEMSLIFLDISTEDMATSLTAQHLLKSLHEKDQDTEYAVELLNQTEYFGRLAVGILNECYINDSTNATLLLVREMESYGGTTLLKMAVEADNKEFVAHAASQNLLTYIWTDRLSEDNSLLRLVFSLFLPIFSPLLLKFRNIDINVDEDINKRKKKKKNISFISRVLRKRTKKVQEGKLADPTTEKVKETDKQTNKETEPEKKKSNCVVRYLTHMKIFLNAPCITFYYNCMSYMAFLMLFSIILLTDFYPPKATHPRIPIKEIILYIWVATILLEKIRQLIVLESSTWRQKVIVFMSDMWNMMDFVCVTVFIIGVILRFIPLETCRTCFYAGRIVLAFNVMMFFARALHMFSVHQQLGPKLVMIKQMLWDLFYFVIIIMVFISAYGITSNVILYPNQLLHISLIEEIFNEAWWSVYGSMNIGLVTDAQCSQKPTTEDPNLCSSSNYTCGPFTCAVYGLPSDQCFGREDSCVANHWVVPILLAFYALITNVMLLNLLIAMFSNTFATIQGKTNIVWKMQRYHLIHEFENRPFWPPPFIFIGHIYQLLHYLFTKHCCSFCRDGTSSKLSFKMKINKVLESRLKVWENIYAEEYLLKSEITDESTLDSHVKETHKKSEKIISKLDDLSECNILTQTTNFTVSNKPKLTPMLEQRFLRIEDQLKKNSRSFQTLLSQLELLDEAESITESDNLEGSINVDMQTIREEETDKFKLELAHHIYSRSVVYPAEAHEKVLRYPVPDNKVDFKVDYLMYKPTEYTSISSLTENLDFKTTVKMNFNSFDQVRNFDRRTRICDAYDVVDSFPMNPRGRTGMRMRGVLKRWGPNPLLKLLLIRWGKMCTDDASSLKPLRFLEFFSVPAPDGSDKNAIPELMYPRSCILPTECLNQYFSVHETIENRKLLSWLESPHAEEVSKAYYLDDPRNTDNAWIEYTCQLFHDDKGSLLRNDNFHFTQEQSSLCYWKQVDNHMNVYSPDMIILKTMADQLNAPY